MRYLFYTYETVGESELCKLLCVVYDNWAHGFLERTLSQQGIRFKVVKD